MMPNEGRIGDELAISRWSILYTVENEDKEAFERFCELRISHSTNSMLCIVFTLVTSYMYLMSVMNPNGGMFMTIVVAIGGIFLNPMLLILVFCQYQMGSKNGRSALKRFEPYIPISMSFVTVFSVLILALYLIARLLNGRCESLDQFHRYSCNSEADANTMPQGTLLVLLLVPFMFSIAFKTVRPPFILLSWAIVVAAVIICISMTKAVNTIPVLFFYIPLSLTCICEVHRQNVNQFLLLKKQQLLLNDITRLSEESQTELRFMIANMAHDLKTPLSAFMNGVETLSAIITDLTRLEGSHLGSGGLLLHSAHESLKNLFTVNSFMTMTVNRCIDYMKASKGIKLEPRMETINLTEVLSMPVRIMRDLQSRIAIVQSPIPTGVCSHIITDLQWLQENLFCLISNAVKYSSHGHISFSLSLIKDTDPPVAAFAKSKRPPTPSNASSDIPVLHEKYAFLDRMSSGNLRSKDPDKQQEFVDLEMAESEADDSSLRFTPKRIKTERLTKSLMEEMTKEAVADDATGPSVVPPTLAAELLLIEVEDTGIGLSDEVKRSLFTPFKQAQRRAGGTGLGLYSLAKRVDALGGFYGVRNRSDGEQGSVFWFAIPYRADLSYHGSSMSESSTSTEKVSNVEFRLADLPPTISADAKSSVAIESSEAKDTPPESSQPPPPPVETVAEVSSRKPRVLVVDDSLTILKMTGHLLKRNGYLVDQEENGATALEALERARQAGVLYDVLLVDLNMPVMDGLEMMKRLRELENLRNAERMAGNSGSSGSGGTSSSASEVVAVEHQRVFAFSANSDTSTMKEAMDAGADDFVCKPFSLQTFKEKMMKG